MGVSSIPCPHSLIRDVKLISMELGFFLMSAMHNHSMELILLLHVPSRIRPYQV